MGDVEGYPRAAVVRDLVMVSSVAGLLVAIHVLVPPATRDQLAFHHGRVDIVSMFTSAFVHDDSRHLLGNVAGYLAPTVVAYGLCLQARARRWFFLTTGTFLAGLPVLVSATSYVALSYRYPGINPVTRGFSGVGAAFMGFVLVALVAVIARAYGTRVAGFVGLAIWLWLLVALSVIYSGLEPLVGLLAAVGWSLCGWGLVRTTRGPLDLRRIRAQMESILSVGLIVVLLTLFVVVLFPADPVNGDAVTNVVAHAAGFGYGIIGSALTLVLTQRR